ncbi:hypothetical protein [Neisseria yangbaofengii]|uniref:hypothetical protein n=1 Tax=Neisseria yangbaofengii TaxID=2709396 RepID=UPI0013ED2541|nr:hypothetical protein [Neisseria yangbaofengii]
MHHIIKGRLKSVFQTALMLETHTARVCRFGQTRRQYRVCAACTDDDVVEL